MTKFGHENNSPKPTNVRVVVRSLRYGLPVSVMLVEVPPGCVLETDYEDHAAYIRNRGPE